MLIWFVAVGAIALLVIADVYFVRTRKSSSQQVGRYRKKKRVKASDAQLPLPPQMKQHRVYDSFEELFVALNGEDHQGLFVLAEDEKRPVFNQEFDR
jgi:hypothetical protein